MKNQKNIGRRLINIAILSLIMLNMFACGTSNQVVSKGLIQKRKYTSGWFVKFGKVQRPNEKTESRVEFCSTQLIEISDHHEKPIALALNRVKLLSSKDNSEDKEVVESIVHQNKSAEITEKRSQLKTKIVSPTGFSSNAKTVEAAEQLKKVKVRKPKRERTYYRDPWLVGFIIIGSIMLVILIITLVLKSAALFQVLALMLGLIGLFLIGYLLFLFFRSIGRFFEALF